MILFLMLASLAIIMFFIYVGGKFLKICLFTFDKLAIFVAVAVNTHKHFSINVASGNAVYFWDVVAGILAIGIYIVVFKFVRKKFYLPGKILNFIVSFFSAYIVYFMLVNIFVHNSGEEYYLPLLNNSVMNSIVNWILVLILSGVIWLKREEYLAEEEEYDFVEVERVRYAKKDDEE